MRAGRHGEDEDAALGNGLAVIGFREVGDLREFSSLDKLVAALMEADPDHSRKRAANQARQLWALKEGIARGDIVVLPLKTRKGQIALRLVTGDYDYRGVMGEKQHTRLVDWVRPEAKVPRSKNGRDPSGCSRLAGSAAAVAIESLRALALWGCEEVLRKFCDLQTNAAKNHPWTTDPPENTAFPGA